MAEVQITDADADVEWFQHGPTTHLTEDGEKSVCGMREVKARHRTFSLDGDELVCPRCADITGLAE